MIYLKMIKDSGKHTHVSLVFGHCCHSILMCGKFYVCLSSYSTIWADLDMDPHRIKWREELRERVKVDR